jgi:hypothetical protein
MGETVAGEKEAIDRAEISLSRGTSQKEGSLPIWGVKWAKWQG